MKVPVTIGAGWLMSVCVILVGCNESSIDPQAGCEGMRALSANVALWDGSKWQPAGDGFDSTGHAATFTPDGRLFVGGEFTHSGNKLCRRIAQWDPLRQEWNELGHGLDGPVYAICAFGSSIYVGGQFTRATNSDGSVVTVWNVVEWDGSAWKALPILDVGTVRALVVTRGTLFIGHYGGLASIDLSTRAGQELAEFPEGLYALAVYGDTLFMGNLFERVNGLPAIGVAILNLRDTSWERPDYITFDYPLVGTEHIKAMCLVGSTLYIGGTFSVSGSESLLAVDLRSGRRTAFQVVRGIECMTTSGSYVYIGGIFWRTHGDELLGVARVNTRTFELEKMDGGLCELQAATAAVYGIAAHDNMVCAVGFIRGAGHD